MARKRTAATPTANVDQLLTDAASADTATAVARLVEAWRACPSPRIAAVAAALSAKLPVEALPAKVDARDARWLQIASTGDRAQLPTLLAAEWPVHPRAAKERLPRLLVLGPDPRIAVALHALWNARRYRSNAGNVFWRKAFHVLLTWGDATVTDYLRAEKRSSDISWFAICETLANKVRVLPAHPTLSPTATAALARLETATATPRAVDVSTIAALYEAVYAEPASDAPRAVLADALLANNDPRGELIQLQLAPPARKLEPRIRTLLRDHGTRWLDGLDPEVIREPEFRRGFVAEAHVLGDRPLGLEHRAWRTLDTIRFLSPPPPGVLGHPNLAGLRCIDQIATESLAGLELQLDRLGLLPPLGPIAAPKLRARVLSLITNYSDNPPSLDDLRTWFASTPLADDVEALELDRLDRELPALWSWWKQLPARGRLAELALRPRFVVDEPMLWELRLTRPATLVATWHGRSYDEADPAALADSLGMLPKNVLDTIVVRTAARLDAATRKRIAAALAPALGRQSRANTTVF